MDDITARLLVKNKEVTEMAKKVMQKLKEEVEKKASNCLSLKMERKEEQDDCFMWLLGGPAASMQQGRRRDDGRQCGNAWEWS